MSSTLKCSTCVKSPRCSLIYQHRCAGYKLQAEASNRNENVLNTASPGRSSLWILRSEMLSTSDRPTTSGLQSPSGVPTQCGPSPATQEDCRQSPCRVPPAQWGNRFARESGEEEHELFGDLPAAHVEPLQDDAAQHEAHQDELDRAAVPSPSNASNLAGPRCINGELVRPTPPRDDSPSTACQASTVCASGGVRLGKANPPCFGAPPGIVPVPSREIPPPPPPPSRQSSSSAANPVTYPMPWTPLNTRAADSSPADRRRCPLILHGQAPISLVPSSMQTSMTQCWSRHLQS